MGSSRAHAVVAGGLGLLPPSGPTRPENAGPAGRARQGGGERGEVGPDPTIRHSRQRRTQPGPASLARAYRLVGLKGYVTNIPAATMPASEVISSYHDLWQVEQSFRMSKTDLRARPMFHHLKDSIEAHLTIVFTALAVSREVQARTGHAIRHVIRTLRPLRSATIAINGARQTFPPVIGSDQQNILDKIRARSR